MRSVEGGRSGEGVGEEVLPGAVELQGLGPQTVGLPVAFLAPVAVILPVNTIPNIVFHSAGYFNQKQMIAYGLVVSLVSTILVLLVSLPYWRLTGLI